MKKGKKIRLFQAFFLAGCMTVGSGIWTYADVIPPLSISGNPVQTVAVTGNSYENIAICRVSNYVNVRSQPNTSSSIVGKIYDDCAATILAVVDGEGGKWYQMKSGNVEGYIKAQFFLTGEEAEKVAKEVGTTYATVTSNSGLRLRQEPSLTSGILTTLDSGTSYEVLGEQDGFAKLLIDDTLQGYVSCDYITTRVEFNLAVTLEEEAAKNQEKEQQKQEAEAAIQKLEETKQENIIPVNPAGEGTSNSTTAPPVTGDQSSGSGAVTSGANGPGYYTAEGEAKVISATREAIVAYAKQFLGNPYVYGGTSLTEGTDCSGFTMSVYSHFGIDTGRSSRDQAAKGREIDISAVQPGDLLFYASGDTINHVALYIGGGQIIHAATSKTGIVIANANYRTPCKAVTFLD